MQRENQQEQHSRKIDACEMTLQKLYQEELQLFQEKYVVPKGLAAKEQKAINQMIETIDKKNQTLFLCNRLIRMKQSQLFDLKFKQASKGHQNHKQDIKDLKQRVQEIEDPTLPTCRGVLQIIFIISLMGALGFTIFFLVLSEYDLSSDLNKGLKSGAGIAMAIGFLKTVLDILRLFKCCKRYIDCLYGYKARKDPGRLQPKTSQSDNVNSSTSLHKEKNLEPLADKIEPPSQASKKATA